VFFFFFFFFKNFILEKWATGSQTWRYNYFIKSSAMIQCLRTSIICTSPNQDIIVLVNVPKDTLKIIKWWRPNTYIACIDGIFIQHKDAVNTRSTINIIKHLINNYIAIPTSMWIGIINIVIFIPFNVRISGVMWCHSCNKYIEIVYMQKFPAVFTSNTMVTIAHHILIYCS